jgi:serine/threonine-protein kinase
MTGARNRGGDTAPENEADELLLADLLDRWYAAEESGEAPTAEILAGVPSGVAHRFLTLVGRAAEVTGSGGRPGATAAPPPVERIGRYRILETRGGGGFADVYLAEDETLGRRVALKVLRDSALRDPLTRRRFRLEGEILAALEHPGIVPIHEAGEDGAYCFLALRWIDGGTLVGCVGKSTPVEAARYGAAAARALHAAHERGIVHRDVKPANILLDDGVPRLADFGLAAPFSARGSPPPM